MSGGIGRAVTLPGRGFRQVEGTVAHGLPERLAGGAHGIVSTPSRLARPLRYVTGGLVAGGDIGQVPLFRPAIDDAVAPSPWGFRNDGFGLRGPSERGGSLIHWLRGFTPNRAGLNAFQPYNSSTPDWTSNTTKKGASQPGSPVPISNKRNSAQGGLRRLAYVDEQLFTLLPRPWIQKPVPFRIREALAQASQQGPSYPFMTRWQAAASYGQTTQTLVTPGLSNLASEASQSTYGAY